MGPTPSFDFASHQSALMCRLPSVLTASLARLRPSRPPLRARCEAPVAVLGALGLVPVFVLNNYAVYTSGLVFAYRSLVAVGQRLAACILWWALSRARVSDCMAAA